MTIDELIAALEKAEGPSMELSRHIAQLIGWVRLSKAEARHATMRWVRPEDRIDGKPVFCQMHGTSLHRDPPHFTAILDAALTLVPEGHDWLRKAFGSMTVVRLLTPEEDKEKTWAVHFDAAHKVAPIALCIAALKARRNA